MAKAEAKITVHVDTKKLARILDEYNAELKKKIATRRRAVEARMRTLRKVFGSGTVVESSLATSLEELRWVESLL